MSDFDFVIVGNGLGAHAALLEFSKRPGFQTKNILQIYDEEGHPACSLKTTGVICLSGVKKGVSPLGDLIFDSYEATSELIESDFCEGVYPSTSYQLCDGSEKDKEDFCRRFGVLDTFSKFSNYELKTLYFGKKWQSFLVKPEEFLPSIERAYRDRLKKLKKKVGVLEEIKEGSIIVSGKKISFHKLILCTGAYTKYEFLKINREILEKTKIVPGAYLTYENIDLGKKSFVISREFGNLIYRSFEKTVMIGGSTIKKEYDYLNELDDIKDQHAMFFSIFKAMNLELPSFDSGELLFGLRHKGKQRIPFCGKLAESIYGMFGLYKNGFTYPFFLAKGLADSIEKNE